MGRGNHQREGGGVNRRSKKAKALPIAHKLFVGFLKEQRLLRKVPIFF